MTKTKCQFLPLAAICRKIKHSFISFLFHVPATLKDDTVFSCDARSMGCENICDILVDTFGRGAFHSQKISYTASKNPFVLKKNPAEIRINPFVLKKSRTHFQLSETPLAFGCHSFRLAIIAGIGRRTLFIEKGA